MPLDTGVTSNSFKVEVIHSKNNSEFDAVHPQWRELEQHGISTVFQSEAWLLPWRRLISPRLKADLIFVTVRNDWGQVVMFLPLCRRRIYGLSWVEFADGGLADYVAPVVAKEFNQSDFGQIWELILSQLPKSDLIRFEKLPENVAGYKNPLTSLPWVDKMDDFAAWGMPLLSCRSDYDKTLRARDRKEIRRKRKNLIAALGDISLIHGNTDSEKRDIFDTLRAHRRARFGKLGRFDILDDPHYLQFYEEQVMRSGLAVVSALKANDKLIATMLGVYYQNTYLLLMHSFDSELESLSPGIVAIDEMTSHLIEKGITHFDFTIGSEGYKKQFGVSKGSIYKGMLARSLKGTLYNFFYTFAHASYRKLRQFGFSPSLWKKRVVSSGVP